MKNKISRVLVTLIIISIFSSSTAVVGFIRPSLGSKIKGTITDGYAEDGIGNVKITLLVNEIVEDIQYSSNTPGSIGDYEVSYRGLLMNPTPCILRVDKSGYMSRNVMATLPKFGDPPATKNIEMDILPITIQGYLTDVEGNIVTGAPIILRRESNDQIIQSTAADLSGYYIIALEWHETTQVYFTGVDDDEETYDVQIEEEHFTIQPATTYTKNLETSTLYRSKYSPSTSYSCNWAGVIVDQFGDPLDFVISFYTYLSAVGHYIDVETGQWVDEYENQPTRPTDIRLQTAFVIQHALNGYEQDHWRVAQIRSGIAIRKADWTFVDPEMNIYNYGDDVRTNAVETSSEIGLISSLAQDTASIIMFFLPDWLEWLMIPVIFFSMAGKLMDTVDNLEYSTSEQDLNHDGVPETEVCQLTHISSASGPLYPHSFSANRGRFSAQFWNTFNLDLSSDPQGIYTIYLTHDIVFYNPSLVNPYFHTVTVQNAIPFYWITP